MDAKACSEERTLRFRLFEGGGLGAVYTVDHEVVPCKRPILRGTTSWDDFHGPSY
jgi:hypothetical protein